MKQASSAARAFHELILRASVALRNRSQLGQGLVEYALVLVFIAIVVIGILTIVGQTIEKEYYSEIVSGIDQ